MSNPYFDAERAEQEIRDLNERGKRVRALINRREAQLVKRGMVPPKQPVPENASLCERLNACSKELIERGPILAKDKLYHALDKELGIIGSLVSRIAQNLMYHRIEQEACSDVYDQRVSAPANP